MKLEVESVPAADAARLLGELEKLEDGAVAIVAGHSNTLPALARALGGELKGLVDSPQGKLIDEHENGRIFVLTRRVEAGAKTETRVLELRCPD